MAHRNVCPTLLKFIAACDDVLKQGGAEKGKRRINMDGEDNRKPVNFIHLYKCFPPIPAMGPFEKRR
jgi:hypothetical protein